MDSMSFTVSFNSDLLIDLFKSFFVNNTCSKQEIVCKQLHLKHKISKCDSVQMTKIIVEDPIIEVNHYCLWKSIIHHRMGVLWVHHYRYQTHFLNRITCVNVRMYYVDSLCTVHLQVHIHTNKHTHAHTNHTHKHKIT